MQRSNPFEKKGSKVNLNRFMSAVKTGKEQESMWTFSLFGYVLTCMDQGYFHGAKFRRPASRKPDAAFQWKMSSVYSVAVHRDAPIA